MEIIRSSIGKNSNSPYIIFERWTNYPNAPTDFEGDTGTCIVYMPFDLKSKNVVATGNDTLRVGAYKDDDTPLYSISDLVKAGDIVIIGSRHNKQYTVDSVNDTTFEITMTADIDESYFPGEMVKVVWYQGSITSSDIVLGKNGTVKNRIQHRMAQTETLRVYPKHRVIFKLKNAGDTVFTQYPDASYTQYHLSVYDDGEGALLS